MLALAAWIALSALWSLSPARLGARVRARRRLRRSRRWRSPSCSAPVTALACSPVCSSARPSCPPTASHHGSSRINSSLKTTPLIDNRLASRSGIRTLLAHSRRSEILIALGFVSHGRRTTSVDHRGTRRPDSRDNALLHLQSWRLGRSCVVIRDRCRARPTMAQQSLGVVAHGTPVGRMRSNRVAARRSDEYRRAVRRCRARGARLVGRSARSRLVVGAPRLARSGA